MRLEGLTQEQIEICDILWTCESVEEYYEFLEVLDERQRKIAQVLVRCIMYEEIEETQMAQLDAVGRYPDAERLLNKIMNNMNRNDEDDNRERKDYD
jgi:hypothetical protein